MQDIITFIITVFTVYLIYTALFYTVKRTQLILKLRALKKDCDARIKYTRIPFLSYFKLSAKPDVIAEIGNRVYLIRLINGKGSLRYLHFASKKYFVSFSKIRISVAGLLRFGAKQNATVSQNTSRHSVKILPELEIPNEYSENRVYSSRETLPVLIFNPAPNEVTYVSETKTSIKAAFEGDEVYGQLIFTPTAFVTYADRAFREEKRRREEEFLWR